MGFMIREKYKRKLFTVGRTDCDEITQSEVDGIRDAEKNGKREEEKNECGKGEIC